jgi:hypothetical protein
MSASLTKRLKAMVDAEGTSDAGSRAVRCAISEGQPDTAYELARGLAHMVRNEGKPGTQDEQEGRVE